MLFIAVCAGVGMALTSFFPYAIPAIHTKRSLAHVRSRCPAELMLTSVLFLGQSGLDQPEREMKSHISRLTSVPGRSGNARVPVAFRPSGMNLRCRPTPEVQPQCSRRLYEV